MGERDLRKMLAKMRGMSMGIIRELWGSIGGRILLAMWSAAFGVVILTQGFGVGPGDALFNFYFGFVPLVVLNNAAVIFSIFVRGRSEQIAKSVWVAQCVLFLGACVHLELANTEPVSSDLRFLVLLIMGLASFPSSIPFGALRAGLDMAFSPVVRSIEWWVSGFLIDWVVFFAAGYLQWFRLLPYLMKLRRRHHPPR